MDYKQLSLIIGKQVLVQSDAFQVWFTVMNAKQSYGQVRLNVSPVIGNGQAWISADRVIQIADVRISGQAVTYQPVTVRQVRNA